VVTLSARISNVGFAHLEDFLEKNRIGQSSQTQFLPINPLPPTNDIVDGRKRQFLMIKMTVNHTKTLCRNVSKSQTPPERFTAPGRISYLSLVLGKLKRRAIESAIRPTCASRNNEI
jgi:hypothetical protein